MIVIRLSTLLACVFPLLSTDLAAGFGAATSRMRSGMTTTSTMPSAPPSMDAAVAHRQHDHHRQHPGGRRWPSSPPPHHLPSLSSSSSRKTTTALLSSSPPSEYGRSSSSEEEDDVNDDDDDDGDDYDDEMGPMSFQKELDRRGGNDVAAMDDDKNGDDAEEEGDEFDGYDLRDVICEKWGECFDVEFQKVDSYGFRSVYLVRAGVPTSATTRPGCTFVESCNRERTNGCC
jgi:hypothetical protein